MLRSGGMRARAVAVLDNSPEAILAILERVLAATSDFDEELSSIEFGDWAKLRVYIPEPDIQSTITPPFMEAFLVLQKQVYQQECPLSG